MTRMKIMPTRRPNRTSLASGALILALMIFASIAIAQAQTNVCLDRGRSRVGILEASLDGTTRSGDNELLIKIPSSEANKWSRVRSSGGNIDIDKPVLDATDDMIVVPADEIALVWIEIQPAANPTKIRLETNLVQSSFQPAAPSLLVSANDNIVQFCIDNKGNTQSHSWHFGLKIGGDWYDPQIENIGSGPPPPPPLPE